MNIRVLLFTLSTAFLVPTLRAEDQPKGPPPGKHHEPATELEAHMEKIGRAFRVLSREVKDATKNEDALRQVAIIRTNAEAATKLKPAKLAEVPAADQAKFMTDYAAKTKAFLADIDSLESALKAGNNAEAAKLVDELKKDRNDGHKEFQKKKDKM